MKVLVVRVADARRSTFQSFRGHLRQDAAEAHVVVVVDDHGRSRKLKDNLGGTEVRYDSAIKVTA